MDLYNLEGVTSKIQNRLLTGTLKWQGTDLDMTTTCHPSSQCAPQRYGGGVWKLGNGFIQSGGGNIEDSESVVNWNFKMAGVGSMDLLYELSCASPAEFKVEINGRLAFLQECPKQCSMMQDSNNLPTPDRRATIPLPKGNINVKFIFDKNSLSNSCDKIEIFKITVHGDSNLKSGTASGCTPCRPGTYSEGHSNTKCRECPAGTSTSGQWAASKCDICPPYTYSDKGWSSCQACGSGTLFHSVDQPCDKNCKNLTFGVEGGFKDTFDISSLGSIVNIVDLEDGSTLFFSLCDNRLMSTYCSSNTSTFSYHNALPNQTMTITGDTVPYACRKWLNGTAVKLGVIPSYSYSGAGLFGPGVTFETKAGEGTPNPCRLVVSLQCGRDEDYRIWSTTDSQTNCGIHLRRKTPRACRLCSAADFKITYGVCSYGWQLKHYVRNGTRNDVCYGGWSPPPTTMITCGDGPVTVETEHKWTTLEITMVVISALSSVCVILLFVVFVFVCKKWVTTEHAYQRLRETTGDVGMSSLNGEGRKGDGEGGGNMYTIDDGDDGGVDVKEPSV
eukprot:TRINITY_DN22077_c0_g1_i1.p1 TRINITY_DN22077_c0_g1~~TRINITY_DN22077_c0_g1_i1.p1  ORF type:complete len:559 (-),score=89.73 TRINITY_DN22077_c0_g1_i1:54-1730(-)